MPNLIITGGVGGAFVISSATKAPRRLDFQEGRNSMFLPLLLAAQTIGNVTALTPSFDLARPSNSMYIPLI